MSGAPVRTGFVAIGRNEGERLKRCLRSIPSGFPIVYVDSGSTDGSCAFAQSLGITVEVLSTDVGFTAARARNMGWRRLLSDHPDLEFIQFIDGDCELAAGWVAKAMAALDADPTLCAVFGRRRERFPNASFYNALCDDEWDVPVGLVQACGGDVLFRAAALLQVGGYDNTLIAGEEPDLCLRLGREGWRVRCIGEEMTLHDADIHHARQQWMRARRAGHAFAEHVSRHGVEAFQSWRRERNSFVVWAAVIPLLIFITGLIGVLTGAWPLIGLMALLAALYPAQVLRIAVRKWRAGFSGRFAFNYGLWMILGKFAQFGGLARYYWGRGRRRPGGLIEYKNASEGRL